VQFAENGSLTVTVSETTARGPREGAISGTYKFTSNDRIEIALDVRSALREADGELPVPGWLPAGVATGNMAFEANVTLTKDRLTLTVGNGKPHEFAREE
jgi:hypothetical protein